VFFPHTPLAMVAASQRRPVPLDAVATFLERCSLTSTAAALRSEAAGKDPGTWDAPDAKTAAGTLCSALRTYLDSLESDLAILEASSLAQERDTVMDQLLRKLMAAGQAVPDSKLHVTMKSVLKHKSFIGPGAAADPAAKVQVTLGVSDAAVQQYWDQVPGSAAGPGEAAAPPAAVAEPVLVSQLPPSASYVARRRRAEGENVERDPEDEYWDDEDPGYRLRELYETELLAELQAKANQRTRTEAAVDGPSAYPVEVEGAAVDLGASAGEAGAETPPLPPRAIEPIPTALQAPNQVFHNVGEQKDRSKRKHLKYAPSGDAFYPVDFDGIVFDSFNLRVVFEREKTGFEESKDFPIKTNSIIAARYQVMDYIGSAAFSKAVQCLDLETNTMVCMKIIKNDKDFFDQSLDEIKLLKLINTNGDVDEKNCIKLYDYFYHKEHLIIVTELLRDNLYEFSKWNQEQQDEPYFTLGRLQRMTFQVLSALEYVHSLGLIHCDLKPENILIKSYSQCKVKVIDFGSSCFTDDHLSAYVQSRSYRAPEVILGLPYDPKIDVWSLGCIIAELWTGYVLFQNDTVQSLLARIMGIIGPIPYDMMQRGKCVPMYFTQEGQLYREVEGTPCPDRGRKLNLLVPKKTTLKHRLRTEDEAFADFLSKLLTLDARDRPTAKEALQHPWLQPGRYSDGFLK